MQKVDKLPEGAKELIVKGYNDNQYTAKCVGCNEEFTYSGDAPYAEGQAVCSADCEQAMFDNGDDPTLWSNRKKLNVGYNKSRLMLTREYIRRINEAALKLEDLFSDWHPDINTSVSELQLELEVMTITGKTQKWMDSIDATFTKENDND